MAREQTGGWRVVYGETMPAWEQTFPTKLEADAFRTRAVRRGDVVFSVKRVVSGEGPQSLTAALALTAGETDAA